MQVELAYGQHGLSLCLPDNVTLLTPHETPGLPDERAAIRAALAAPLGCLPLRERVRADDRVVIVFSDITRPMPSDRVLPPLLEELAHVPRERIVLLNATGSHRVNTPAELEKMLGSDIVHNYAIQQHNAWDEANLVDLGTSRFGHTLRVNRTYYEASFKILTGFIEPHIFAGYSGGPKAVLPGVAGIDTIMDNHSFEMLNHPQATWGETEGNPIWEEMRELATLTHPDFLLNVTVNRRRQITGVYAGELAQAHARGVAAVRHSAMVDVDAPFDIVLTTNSGYPLDINLYQAAKGMSAAARIVKPGGSIIIAVECRDGIPDYGEYRDLIHEGGSLEGVLKIVSQPGYRRHDMWQGQLQVGIQQKADVYVYSDGLSDAQIAGMLFLPCRDIPATLDKLLAKYGPAARVCVLPEGPQTIPCLRPCAR